jgi:ubiquinone biosynthesis protein COQ9
MRDQELVIREMNSLHLRLAELELITESLEGEKLTYLDIKLDHAALTEKQSVIAEQKKISEKLKALIKECLQLQQQHPFMDKSRKEAIKLPSIKLLQNNLRNLKLP